MSRIRRNAGADDLARRERYVESWRKLLALAEMVEDAPGTVYPDDGLPRAEPGRDSARMRDQITRLDAGEAVEVRGWEVGIANSTTYIMDGAGRLRGHEG